MGVPYRQKLPFRPDLPLGFLLPTQRSAINLSFKSAVIARKVSCAEPKSIGPGFPQISKRQVTWHYGGMAEYRIVLSPKILI